MKLIRALIENYRSIKHAVVTFEPRCRILVGVNESGKSNVLQALALLSPNKTPKAEDRREVTEDEAFNQDASVCFIFSPDKADYEEATQIGIQKIFSPDSVPIILNSPNDTQLTLKEVIQLVKEVIYEVSIPEGERSWLQWAIPENEPKGYSMSGKWHIPRTDAGNPFIEYPGQSPVRLKSILLLEQQDGWTPDPDSFEKATPAKVIGAVAKLLLEVCPKHLPECILWNHRDEALLPGKIHLAPFSGNPDSCLPLKQMFLLSGVTDIPAAIAEAQSRPNGIPNLLKRISTSATKHLHRVWEEAKSVQIELVQNGEHIDAAIRDTFNSFDFSRRSDGFKRFVTFLLLVSAKNQSGAMRDVLYLHDEPEIGLHPSGARYLCSELIRISQSNYVVFSTHSIFMIDRDNVSRHFIVQKSKESTELVTVDKSDIKDEEVIYRALGYSIFDVLKKQNIIFEGWKDKRLFETALAGTSREAKELKTLFEDIGRCHSVGVKDIPRVAAMLDLADRDYVIVSDNDAVARQQKSKNGSLKKWITYADLLPAEFKVETVEDFITGSLFEEVILDLKAQIVELEGLPNDFYEERFSKLARLKKLLQGKGLNADQIQERMETIKNRLFDHLKPEHLDSAYLDFLKALKKSIDK